MTQPNPAGHSGPNPHRLLPRLVKREDRYRRLLIALVALTITYPLINAWPAGRLIEQVALVAVLITTTLAVYKHRYQIVLALLALGILVAATLFEYLGGKPLPWLVRTQEVAVSLFLVHATIALARDIFSSRERISVELLFGAASVYLLIGIAFASLHFLLETLVSGSYQCGSPVCRGTPLIAAYVYYSFVTLATVGYGDIIPASHTAAMLAYMEAVVGQLYTAILVARLVGMHLALSRD